MSYCEYCGEEFGHKSMCLKKILDRQDFEARKNGQHPLKRR